jgi:hypothetical protein
MHVERRGAAIVSASIAADVKAALAVEEDDLARQQHVPVNARRAPRAPR